MPKAASTSSRKPRSPSRGKKTKTPTGSVHTLKQKKTALQDEFSNSGKTKVAYKGYLDRGRAILADVVTDKRQKEKEDASCPELEGIDTKILAEAFDGPPNKHSAYALELYLTQKCVVEGYGKSTAEGIHGAFAKYWDGMPGGKYTGAYSYDEDTGRVSGNPARAPEIQSFVKCIKNKARVKGAAATRHHAEATTIEDMQKLMQWSALECPPNKLEAKPENVKDLLKIIKHGMMRAFLTSGYVLWTRELPRNFETCQIQERDLSDGNGPSPYRLPFLGVFLDNRKGWQQKQGYDGPLESNHYQIYEQNDTPEIDMFTHVLRWRALSGRLLGRDFEPDDYLFPYISSNGTIHSKRPMTHDSVQDLINEFALSAKINKIFTTHCLRRGGSQYRFMHAPIGKRWSLSIIRWWGGWAAGEHVDTLMRYLLDSLQSYESGHGDALYPFRMEPAKSFMGDHNALQPPTTAEFRVLGNQLLTTLDTLVTASQPSAIAAMVIQQTAALSSLGITRSTSDSAIPSSAPPKLPRPVHMSASGSHLALDSAVPDENNQHFTGSDEGSTLTMINVIPLPGAIIPGVGKDGTAWKRAIDQWYHGDPTKGLVLPLKDWPTDWYTGSMRLKTGALYSNRKLLAEEYERYIQYRICLPLFRPYVLGWAGTMLPSRLLIPNTAR
ncbi:hypothetical protein B0H15DRAFT_773173 [Mycena belliarum]|uniref:Integrase n=1 Tax=Mycena belliarum TaxID=1033014 RepID=A0AAD6XUY8_9AGAR|nr:hypothetical protein B0H15DRAFT_773173 [Mycena belliae]